VCVGSSWLCGDAVGQGKSANRPISDKDGVREQGGMRRGT